MIRAGTFREDLLLPAQRDRAARCRRWPSGPTTSCRWPSTSSPPGKTLAAPAQRRAAATTPGRATCASSRTSCSARPARARRRRSRAADLGLRRAAARARRRPMPSSTATAIEQALARAGGVVAQAAAELGLSRQALYRRMERLGISRSPNERCDAHAGARSRLGSRPRSACCSSRSRSPRSSRSTVSARRSWSRSRCGVVAVAADRSCCRWSRAPRRCAPLLSMFRALAGTVPSYRDGDFASACTGRATTSSATWSTRTTRSGDVLRDQRLDLVQRELLLDTMVQNTPVAMLLVDRARRRSSSPTSPRASCSTTAAGSKAIASTTMLVRDAARRCARRSSAAATACSRSARERRTTRRTIYHLARRSVHAQRPRATSSCCCASSPPSCAGRKCRPGRR